ncbi:hypothetical protein Tsubulata_023042 [Turnera subulata]|uniref:Uncharacterized protein n=1 Tax=Turnera subulata TaxID=218843 RepID=A0A9Q0J2P6_9ROSI|nr:hypothetical protein Tsubulata_023042 [Turnera subulata]
MSTTGPGPMSSTGPRPMSSAGPRPMSSIGPRPMSSTGLGPMLFIGLGCLGSLVFHWTKPDIQCRLGALDGDWYLSKSDVLCWSSLDLNFEW